MMYYLKFVSVDFKDFSEEITYNVSLENFDGYIICWTKILFASKLLKIQTIKNRNF